MLRCNNQNPSAQRKTCQTFCAPHHRPCSPAESYPQVSARWGRLWAFQLASQGLQGRCPSPRRYTNPRPAVRKDVACVPSHSRIPARQPDSICRSPSRCAQGFWGVAGISSPWISPACAGPQAPVPRLEGPKTVLARCKCKHAKDKARGRPGLRCYWWVLTGSNRRHSPCKGDALPTELSTRTMVQASEPGKLAIVVHL